MTNAIGEIITPGELRALVQRVEQAERDLRLYIDAMKPQAEQNNKTIWAQQGRINELERECDEARAQAAALRDALEELHGLWLIAKPLIERGDDPHLVPFMELHQPLAVIGAALKGDGGAAMLAVVTAARELECAVCELEPTKVYMEQKALRAALANLDGRRC